MAIRIKCSQCGKGLQGPDTAAGKRVKCPGCGAVLSVPAPARLAMAQEEAMTRDDIPLESGLPPAETVAPRVSTPAGKPAASAAPARGSRKKVFAIAGIAGVLVIAGIAALVLHNREGGEKPRTEAELVALYQKYAAEKDWAGIESLTCQDGVSAERIAVMREHMPDILFAQKIQSVKIEPISAEEKAELMQGSVSEGKLYVPNLEPISKMVVAYETGDDSKLSQSDQLGWKGKTCYIVGTKEVDAPTADSIKDPAARALLGKTLVVVTEVGGAIIDVQALDAVPEDDIVFKDEKGVVVTLFGTAIEGYDAAHPAGRRVSNDEEVTVSSYKEKVFVSGQHQYWGVPLDNAFFTRVQAFRNSPAGSRPRPSQEKPARSAEEDYSGVFYKPLSPITQAIRALLEKTGQTKLLKETKSISTSSYDDYARAVATVGGDAKIIFYLFKEGDEWVAYDQVPTHKDSFYVFWELACQHLTEKRGQPTSANFADQSWKNTDKERRIINVVYDDGGKRSDVVPLDFRYTEKDGWHVAAQAE